MVSAFSIGLLLFVRRRHRRFFPLLFLFWMMTVWFLPLPLPSNVWDNASSHSRKNRERDPNSADDDPRRTRKPPPDVPRRRIRRAASSRVVVLSLLSLRCCLSIGVVSRVRTRHNPIQKQRLDQSGTTWRGVKRRPTQRKRERERERNERQERSASCGCFCCCSP